MISRLFLSLYFFLDLVTVLQVRDHADSLMNQLVTPCLCGIKSRYAQLSSIVVILVTNFAHFHFASELGHLHMLILIKLCCILYRPLH